MIRASPPRQGQSRTTKFGLLGVVGFLLLAGAYTSLTIVRRQAELQQVSGYNVTWLVSQATLEIARLHGAIASALVPNSGVDEDDVDLRLDIVANRVGLFAAGDVAGFVATSPEFGRIVQSFRTVAAQARAEFDASGRPDRLLRMLKPVGELNAPMARLAAAASAYGGDLVGKDQRQLSSLHWTFAAILGSLTLCGFGLVGTLAWHNRLLALTQNKVQQQNDALQLRDVELNTKNSRFDAALNNMSHALCMMDATQRLIVCNVQFLQLFNLEARDASPGTPASTLFSIIAVASRFGARMIEAMSATQLRRGAERASGTFTEQDLDGRTLAISQEPMIDGGWVATFEDITERRFIEARISFMAHHDDLTGLPNRVLFHSRLEHALEQYVVDTESVAVLCLDLDQFKQVNDTLGHPAGDRLLKDVAARLETCVRERDLVVRLGGDEFAILQTGQVQPMAAEILAQRAIEELGRPYEIEGQRVVVGTSVGVAIASPGFDVADALLKSADIALYCAKADGRGAYRLFESAMDTQVQLRRAMESDLREALGRDEFQVFYQPMVHLETDRVCGFEALLRWRHPTRGMISPAVFIPVAEEMGLIIPIGEWVLAQACADAAAWRDELTVSVNLSPVQFRSQNLVAAVQHALRVSGLPSSRLELEITESALLQDSQTVLGTLHQLEALGTRIALDDFGTGYSSLSYLRSFPFSKLKIDQSFIKEVAYRADCEAIVRAVTNLAHTLGMVTTAEGVETEEQLDRLRDVGCTQVQGFLFDRPRPVSEIGQWSTPRTGLDIEHLRRAPPRGGVPNRPISGSSCLLEEEVSRHAGHLGRPSSSRV